MSIARIDGVCLAMAWLGVALSAAIPVQALPLCTHLPRYGWVSLEEVEARLKSAGFKLLRLRITNEACYLATVENAAGLIFDLRVHPATSEILFPAGVRTGSIKR